MLKIYNTLNRRIEEFKPLINQKVGMYSCGPTVYDYQHIGHMRRYVGDDILKRVLKYNGFHVHHIMNITDVGHLVSDSDSGEDKMEKGARKFGKSVWEIAKMFEDQFKDSCRKLNIDLPKDLMHATAYIKEQIDLIKKLKKKGFIYETSDGIYFNTSKFPNYFQLSRQNPQELLAGARVDLIDEKVNITDFALWKFDDFARKKGEYPKRQMSWWFEGRFEGKLLTKEDWEKIGQKEKLTVGFPGWHIECSAMSMKALGESFDIHTGGIDHINIHHTNEIAQSEAATGKKFVNYWVHHNFLEVEGQKMSKSLDNFITVQEIIKKGYDPLALRYLYLQTHYRKEMNFTWESLDAAQTILNRIRFKINNLLEDVNIDTSIEKMAKKDDQIGLKNKIIKNFNTDINYDLSMPQALAGLLQVIESDLYPENKLKLILKMDEVLGLNLNKQTEKTIIPENIVSLINKREIFRREGNFFKADEIRQKIYNLGYEINDTKNGPEIKKIR